MKRFTVLCLALILIVGLLITVRTYAQDAVGFGVLDPGEAGTNLEGPFSTAAEASEYGRDMVFRNEALRFLVFRSCGGFYCRIWHSAIRDEGPADEANLPPAAGRGFP